jgi:hypothetical protein
MTDHSSAAGRMQEKVDPAFGERSPNSSVRGGMTAANRCYHGRVTCCCCWRRSIRRRIDNCRWASNRHILGRRHKPLVNHCWRWRNGFKEGSFGTLQKGTLRNASWPLENPRHTHRRIWPYFAAPPRCWIIRSANAASSITGAGLSLSQHCYGWLVLCPRRPRSWWYQVAAG